MINFFLKLALQLAATRLGGWLFTTVTPPLDRTLLRLSRGRRSLAGGHMPILLLTTTGRRTGKARATPLLYLRDGERIVVTGSRGGRRRQAAWYLNLLADPRASILLDGEQHNCTAYEARGAERQRLWCRLVTVNPGFNTYQQRLTRCIPVMVLQRL